MLYVRNKRKPVMILAIDMNYVSLKENEVLMTKPLKCNMFYAGCKSLENREVLFQIVDSKISTMHGLNSNGLITSSI